MRVRNGSTLLRGTLLIITVALILAVYGLLGSVRESPVDLCDTYENRFDWTYETLDGRGARAFTPVFHADTYGMDALPDDCRAVKIQRVMTRALDAAKLVFAVGDMGLEVALDGEILYSDFQTSQRDRYGYLTVDDGDFSAHMREFRMLYVPLPTAHAGKTLAVVTYFPRDTVGVRLPVYPVVETEWAANGGVVEAVAPIATTTLFAVLTVLLLVMFFVGRAHDPRDWSYALLALYFLLLFLFRAYNSLPGIFSGLSAYWMFGMVEHLYPTPLYMALATRLHGWRKWGLFSATIAQCAFSVWKMARIFQREGFLYSADGGKTAAALFVLAIVCVIAERATRKDAPQKRRYLPIMAIVLSVAIAYILYDARRHGFTLGLYFRNVLDSAWEFGNYLPLIQSISAIVAYSAAIMLAWGFVSQLLERQRTHMAIAERSRLTLAHYQNLLDMEEKDKQLRHEMRHHLDAISALLDSGDCARARAYTENVAMQARDARPIVSCRNLLVSAIVARYFQAARDAGIETNAHILVPAQLHIADEDLCVYLTNLLENALEACQACDGAAMRYIRFTMEKQGNFVYIGCKNSACAHVELQEDGIPHTTKHAPGEHGYGMIAMRRVAEKYHSVLLIKQTPGEFSVMTNLQDQ